MTPIDMQYEQLLEMESISFLVENIDTFKLIVDGSGDIDELKERLTEDIDEFHLHLSLVDTAIIVNEANNEIDDHSVYFEGELSLHESLQRVAMETLSLDMKDMVGDIIDEPSLYNKEYNKDELLLFLNDLASFNDSKFLPDIFKSKEMAMCQELNAIGAWLKDDPRVLCIGDIDIDTRLGLMLGTKQRQIMLHDTSTPILFPNLDGMEREQVKERYLNLSLSAYESYPTQANLDRVSEAKEMVSKDPVIKTEMSSL